MSSAKLTAIGIVRAKPGQEQELGRRMAALLEPTRAEAGCIAYDLFQSTDNPGVWVLIERWRSVADLNAHVVTDHMAAFLARSAEVIYSPPESFRLRSIAPLAQPKGIAT
jgi:quinol monooxygenase YgiN